MRRKIASAIAVVFILTLSMANWCMAENNYHDTPYTYKFSNYTPYAGWHTQPRPKLDYSSSYMSCTASSGLTYTAWVSAATSNSDVFVANVGSPTYKFYAGYTTYMINYVRENGYSHAAIEARPDSAGSYTAEGLWSPDSI